MLANRRLEELPRGQKVWVPLLFALWPGYPLLILPPLSACKKKNILGELLKREHQEVLWEL